MFNMLGILLLVLLVPLAAECSSIRILKLSDGVPFQMGKVDSRRIVHPGMGAKKLTLNYSVSQPGHEFPQHVHDNSARISTLVSVRLTFRLPRTPLSMRVGQHSRR